jgi:hypothetical protein
MWGLVLLFALSAAQDPLRIGVMTLLIARPRPMHNLLAYWLGLMATGFGAALAALFLLRDFMLPVVRVVTSIAASPVVPPIQIALGVLALSAAAMLVAPSAVRRATYALMPGGDPSLGVLQPNPDCDCSAVALQPKLPAVFSRVSCLLNGKSLGMAFVAGLCTSTQVIECGAAMIAILASGAGAGTRFSAALLFSLVAFAIVEIPLVSCLVSPAGTKAIVMRLHDWLRAYRRPIFVLMICVVGVFMVANGVGRI